MSPINVSCAICGVTLSPKTRGFPRSWGQEVRGIYTLANDNFTRPQISGIGYCDDDIDPISLPLPGNDIQQFQPGPPTGSDSEDSLCFPFHSACYDILAEVWGAPLSEDDIKSIYSIFCSIRYHKNTLRWGHGYGGEQQFGRVLDKLSTDGRDYWMSNPAPEDADIGGTTVHSNEHDEMLSGRGQTGDPFQQQPLELINMIYRNLDLEDVRNLRKASYFLARVPPTRTFWRSRFWPRGEYGFAACFLRDIQNPNYEAICRSLRTNKCPQLRNRARIWKLALGISDLLETVGSSSIAGCPCNHALPCTGGFTSVLSPGSDDDGCRELHQVDAIFPDLKLHKLAVSFVVIAGHRLVSGLRLSFRTQTVEVGYLHKETSLLYCKEFLGFQVVFDNHGMRAIAFENVGDLEWVGDPTIGSRGKIVPSDLYGLRVGIDALRITSMYFIKKSGESQPRFDSTLWSPTFLPEGVEPNEYLGLPEPCEQTYCPVSFIIFRDHPVSCITAHMLGSPAEVVGISLTYVTGKTDLWGSVMEAASLSFFLHEKECLSKLILQRVQGAIRLKLLTNLGRRCSFTRPPDYRDPHTVTLTSRNRIVGLFGCFTRLPRKYFQSLASLGILTSSEEKITCDNEDLNQSVSFRHSGPLDIRWMMQDQFRTSVRLTGSQCRIVRAYICPGGRQYRKEGDITGLQFSVAGDGTPDYVGQLLSNSRSESVTLDDDELLIGIQFSYRKIYYEGCAYRQVVGAGLFTSIRTVEWNAGAAEYEKNVKEFQDQGFKISWVFNAVADLVELSSK